MLFFLVNLFFNGYLLTWAYIFGFLVVHYGDKLGTHYPIQDWVWYACGFVTTLACAGLGFTRRAQWVMRVWLNIRRATKSERDQIEPLLSSVLAMVNKTHNTQYKVEQIKLMIADSKDANAQAMGYSTLIVTRGLLKDATKEELQAVLAHEVAHMYHKDSLMLMVLVFSSLATRIFMWLYWVYSIIAGFIAKTWGKQNNLINFIGLFPLLVFLPIVVFNWLGGWLLKICLLLHSRRCEYRADRFAADLGYTEGLVSFLERIDQLQESKNSLLGMIFASHPAAMKRIDRLNNYVPGSTIAKHAVIARLMLSWFPVIAVLLLLIGGIMEWKIHSVLAPDKLVAAKIESGSRSIAKAVAKKVHHHAPAAAVVHAENTVAPWVYIYNTTTVNQKCCRVDYRLENQGAMQHMMVKQMPHQYKMSLADLEALQ